MCRARRAYVVKPKKARGRYRARLPIRNNNGTGAIEWYKRARRVFEICRLGRAKQESRTCASRRAHPLRTEPKDCGRPLCPPSRDLSFVAWRCMICAKSRMGGRYSVDRCHQRCLCGVP
ncbi:hypothetical protein IEO21_09233 [Rhodonia placenta]|uniref:Uncharacterized protein n=1 Tax=Rhodonia placenta TaxID=104341 RepID=A0A8H7NUW0_9APHY|nr:hypothetical protein IEO21_09233 [Postia placenta]